MILEESWPNWLRALVAVLIALAAVAIVGLIVWGVEDNNGKNERLARQCMTDGGTWAYNSCFRAAGR